MHDAANLPDSAVGSKPQSPATPGSALTTLPRRDAILILVSIMLITALAWLYLLHLDRQMGPAMVQDQTMAAMGMPMINRGLWLTFSLVL